MSSLHNRLPRFVSLALGGLGVLAAGGCEEDTKYSYFSVNVTIAEPADADFLARIATCGANVEGADTDFSPLSCGLGSVRSRDLGTFEWSTAETSGTVRFKVTLKDIAGKEMAVGTSADVPITAGSTTTATVVATPLPGAIPMPP